MDSYCGERFIPMFNQAWKSRGFDGGNEWPLLSVLDPDLIAWLAAGLLIEIPVLDLDWFSFKSKFAESMAS